MLSRSTFTVEVWYDRHAERVAATRVVHLPSRAQQAWPGWHATRVTRFMRALLPGPAGRPVSRPCR